MIKKSASKLKQLINIPYWLDLNRIILFTFYIAQGIKSFIIPQKAVKPNTFDATVKKLDLTEKELFIKQRALYRLALVMLFCAFLLLCYAVYQLWYGTLRATGVSLVVMGIALVMAFRYHFWYFQVKTRKLGCSFREWLRALRGGNDT